MEYLFNDNKNNILDEDIKTETLSLSSYWARIYKLIRHSITDTDAQASGYQKVF